MMQPISYLVDSTGHRIAVLLDIETYEQLIQRLEDYEDAADARDYEARERAGLLTPDEREVITLDQAMAEIEAECVASEQSAA